MDENEELFDWETFPEDNGEDDREMLAYPGVYM